MAIGYTRVNWQAYPSTTTKVSATNLNVMDKGIKDCADAIDGLSVDVSAIDSRLSTAETKISNIWKITRNVNVTITDSTHIAGGAIKDYGYGDNLHIINIAITLIPGNTGFVEIAKLPYELLTYAHGSLGTWKDVGSGMIDVSITGSIKIAYANSDSNNNLEYRGQVVVVSK